MAEANSIMSVSKIDHFASSSLLYESVLEAGVIHCGENLSAHSAIYAKLSLDKLI